MNRSLRPKKHGLPSTTHARTQDPRSPTPARATGAGPANNPGHEKAHQANIAEFSSDLRVPPAASRAKFTLAEIEALRRYAVWGFLSRGIPDRKVFLGIVKDAAPLARRLDVADVVLLEVGRLIREMQSAARRSAARRTRERARIAALAALRRLRRGEWSN